MKNKIKWIIKYFKRKRYQAKIKENMTIISNDCCAGCIYNDIGFKFLSPTINLYINGEDFVRFVKNLKVYLNIELKEFNDNNYDYPVGILFHELYGNVKIFFVHYKSFLEAKLKWDERKKRVDWNNLLILFHVNDECVNFVDDIKHLKVAKKIITYKSQNILKDDNIIEMKKLKKFINGNILKVDRFTGRRYLEEIDYIKLFNRKEGND